MTLPLARYKYIYIRSPKAASTSIVNVLGECDNVRTRGYNSSSCMALHFYWPKSMLQLDSLQQMWKDYFVFGFVRNPWRRAYSLYKYIHSNGCMDRWASISTGWGFATSSLGASGHVGMVEGGE